MNPIKIPFHDDILIANTHNETFDYDNINLLILEVRSTSHKERIMRFQIGDWNEIKRNKGRDILKVENRIIFAFLLYVDEAMFRYFYPDLPMVSLNDYKNYLLTGYIDPIKLGIPKP